MLFRNVSRYDDAGRPRLVVGYHNVNRAIFHKTEDKPARVGVSSAYSAIVSPADMTNLTSSSSMPRRNIR